MSSQDFLGELEVENAYHIWSVDVFTCIDAPDGLQDLRIGSLTPRIHMYTASVFLVHL